MTPQELAARFAPLATHLSIDDVADLQRAMTERSIAPGEVVLREGTDSDTLHLVWDGELAVSIESGVELGRCGGGSIVGEVSLLDCGPASATVTATRPTTLLSLDRSGLETLHRDSPRAATALLRALCATLARRVRTSSDELERLVGDGSTKPPERSSFLGVLRSLFFSSKGDA
jgi:CRP-like cAMP-binding protein